MKPFSLSCRHRTLLLLCATLATLAGCGGGGGGDDSASASSSRATPASPAAPASSASTPNASTPAGAASTPLADAPTGGDASPSAGVPKSTTPNVHAIAVGLAPGLTRNMLTTSVTVCQSGTSNCATIDNIQVDTGSHGLRILASALPASLGLPATASGSGVAGECAVFGGGYTWGAVRTADVRMAGQLAASLPIQVIADPAVPNVPDDCASAASAMQTVASLRSNGILGVGLFAADCGSACASTAAPRWYYGCDASGACASSTQAVAQQVTNPVSRFPLDNNGVVIDLPAIADDGAASVSGSMIFGIDTQPNNMLGAASVIKANAATGYVSTKTATYTNSRSYIDSGSNGIFFRTAQLPQCGYWYCPSSMTMESATILGTDGASAAISFAVGNSSSLFASSNNAFNDLAGVATGSFGWGLPFFFGRRVYTAISGRDTSAGPGPYYAF
ncbi:DUF3443 domain-containing protein [Paraburkholderia metrosideri]|uniref:DUF3443 domain-containing protein n=1 Tax=Paraburkholderia metrosideri TaxID=580937 RepID=A0ABN7HUY9_9BURK|nr:DUF3443 domain-containing protein [Paraburkholderia metrosideri]CAD6537434.1 hypothetical protein LMG28140_03170 [Paraburkholderia metrosideri]